MVKKTYITIQTKDLIPYEKNNKKHGENVARIVASIQRNQYITPIVVDEDNVIIAWHGRRLALIELWIEEAEVLKVSWLTKQQKADLRISDNRIAELSERDWENLQIELDELDIPELNDLFDEMWDLEDDFTLPSWEKWVIETMTFTLHKNQKQQVDEAIEISKRMWDFWNTGNENSNWNAISRICEIFTTQNQ